ncbi:hypothetical protein BC936DRAFT_144589 [Jimgerdemannia flammicorona]|uniref:Uncharacterized protein n=2 Tax=Jimgerdemannia flammicorona TaxID=994334 RepID=A0A433P4P7_9FUNG|nr:hypothetical protein BC936DRAFT_144589 [Jimgerdemannia flammicorona]RUS12498.1 hypothetical protein BC938DRAFT_478862 [Jimgerdemannia flammicorona]
MSQQPSATQDTLHTLTHLHASHPDLRHSLFDDRGRFIHLTPADYDTVASFVTVRGRVSLAELAANSGKLLGVEEGEEGRYEVAM